MSGRVFVQPGEIYVTRQPVEVVTVLGSCVGTIFYHRPSGLGALSHAMYPLWSATHRHRYPAPYYVDRAIELMVERFGREGIIPSDIDAYLFGGGALINPRPDSRFTIGSENYQVARRIIALHGVRLRHSEAVTSSGQHLVLDLARHRIWLDHLSGDRPEAGKEE